MSFSAEIKHLIISEPIARTCCKKSFLTGVLAAKGFCEGTQISLSIAGSQTIAFVKSIVKECYGKEATVFHDRSTGIASTLSFSSKKAAELIEMIEDGASESELFGETCDKCESRFLRGIFLACGRMTDPQKQYLLEFSAGERTDVVERLLWRWDMAPRRSDRRKEKLLVIKDSSSMEDFLVLADINRFAFRLMDAKIEHNIKAQANRVANCEAVNISRSVEASSKQIEAIRKLQKSGAIAELPPDLIAAAQARLAMKDASLLTVASSMTPPLTKSGLAHRLDKICRIAEDIKEEK